MCLGEVKPKASVCNSNNDATTPLPSSSTTSASASSSSSSSSSSSLTSTTSLTSCKENNVHLSSDDDSGSIIASASIEIIKSVSTKEEKIVNTKGTSKTTTSVGSVGNASSSSYSDGGYLRPVAGFVSCCIVIRMFMIMKPLPDKSASKPRLIPESFKKCLSCIFLCL